MAPASAPNLSPAELSYLHTSLSQTPPIRPDGRTPTQFRPLIAETDILPTANGSARICFADGTEAVVGVKAEVEKTVSQGVATTVVAEKEEEDVVFDGGVRREKGREQWLEVAIDMPGFRDDDALPVFLGAMLSESLVADGNLKDMLYINNRFHWRLYVDILLLSAPHAYPLPLLSLTTHLALLQTRLPALISEKDEDPLFNDDWNNSVSLYTTSTTQKPPLTLLTISVASNILFDPSHDELAVADSVIAVSVAQTSDDDAKGLRVLAMRTVDPPSRLTGAGMPDSLNSVTGGQGLAKVEALAAREVETGVWRPPRGGVNRALVKAIVKMVVEKDGVGDEILEALAKVET